MTPDESKRFSQIIATHSAGIKLNSSAEAFIRGLLRSHPKYVAISLQATHFSVQASTCGRFSCKLINAHVGGKRIPLTKSKLEGKKQTNRQKALGAMRSLIQEQIDAYRKQRMLTFSEDNRCPLSGISMLGKSVHVDHFNKPFSTLVKYWCKENSIDLTNVACTQWGFKDSRLNLSWQDYHRKHASLQLVTAKANLKKGNRVK